MDNEITHLAFAGARRIAAGPLREVVAVLKERFDHGDHELVLVFERETGRQVDFDLRGSLDQVLERAAPTVHRRPGRPRLGVTSREVSLLPRHWDWLETQPSGASSALRRLIEQAMKGQSGKTRARQLREAASRFMTSIAGDRPNYEEATRALFAGEVDRFEALVARWPKDVREHAVTLVHEAARADEEAKLHTSST